MKIQRSSEATVFRKGDIFSDRARLEDGRSGVVARVLAVLLVLVPPLLVLPGLHEPYRLVKQVCSEVLGLGLLAAISWTAAHSPARRAGALIAQVVVPVLPLVLAVAVSATFSSHDALSVHACGTAAVAIGVLCGLALWRYDLRRVLAWLRVPAAVLAGVLVVQFVQGGAGMGPEPRLRLTSLAGNVGDLSAYLVLPALLAQSALGSGLVGGSARRRLVWWLALALVLGALFLAQTLVPIAALAVGSGVLWMARSPGSRGRWLRLTLVAVVGLAAALLSPLGSRLAIEWRELRAGSVQDVLSGRLDGWRAGLRIGREHSLVGAGPGAFRAEFAEAKLSLIHEGIPFYAGHGHATHFDHAHSEPIEVFADLGLAGLLASAWLLAFLVRGALTKKHRKDRALGLAILAAFSVLALFWFPLRTALVSWPYVVAGAWLLSTAPVCSGHRERVPVGDDPDLKAAGPPRWLFAALAALLLGAATLVWAYRGLERLWANQVLRVAEDQALLMTSSGLFDRTALRTNARALETARRRAPDDERIPLAIGSHYLLLDDLQKAEIWYRTALDLAPRAETYLNLGRALSRRGDVDSAQPLFDRAVTLNPALRSELPHSR